MTGWRRRCLAAVMAGIGLLLGACAHVFTLNYSADELSQRLTPLFPLQQEQGPFTIRLTQPTVRLDSTENRFGIQFMVDVQGLGLKTGGSTLVEGTVEYRAAQRAFYVVKPGVKELKLRGLPAMMEGPLLQAVNFVAALALKERPIYTLDPKLSREALAITHLRGVRVANNQLQVDVSLGQP